MGEREIEKRKREGERNSDTMIPREKITIKRKIKKDNFS